MKQHIIVVNVINGGGLVLNSHFLLESLSPYIQLHIYHRMRKTDNIQDIGTCVDEDAPEFYYDELNYIEEKKHD